MRHRWDSFVEGESEKGSDVPCSLRPAQLFACSCVQAGMAWVAYGLMMVRLGGSHLIPGALGSLSGAEQQMRASRV